MQKKRQAAIVIAAAVLFAAVLLLSLGLKADTILSPDKEKKEKTKITILTTDVVKDQSWGSLAYKAMLGIEDNFPVKADLKSNLKTNKQMEQAAKSSIEQGASMIIGHGREFNELFDRLAPSHKKVQFVNFHTEASEPNHTVYTFDQSNVEQAAALAASLKTKTNKIGLIDAQNDRVSIPGFEQGLAMHAPEAFFYYRVAGSFDDSEKALELAEEMISQGVDVIYSRGNGYNRAIIDYANKKGVYVIGYLDDQAYMAPDTVLTSVLNDIPAAYTAIMNHYFSSEGMPGGKVILSGEHGVYKLAPPGSMYSEQEKEKIRRELE